MLESLGAIYGFDAEAGEQGLTPQQRLVFHQTNSVPVMEALHQWMEAQFAECKTEPNSGLREAISYLLKHWTKLTLFLRQAGAHVGDLFMSLIHTCELNGANPFDYLSELLRHSAELSTRPGDWLPWNYRARRAEIPRPKAA